MKKILSLVLALSLAGLMITGCNSSTANSGSSGGNESSGFPGDPPDGAPGGGPGGGPGSSSADIDYSGAEEITDSTTQDGQTYSSTTVDQSALLISTDGTVTINNPTVTKSGD